MKHLKRTRLEHALETSPEPIPHEINLIAKNYNDKTLNIKNELTNQGLSKVSAFLISRAEIKHKNFYKESSGTVRTIS